MKFLLASLLVLSLLSSVIVMRIRKHRTHSGSRSHRKYTATSKTKYQTMYANRNNEPAKTAEKKDWSKTATFAEYIGTAIYAEKDVIPKCIPPSWKEDGDIRTNKGFKKSIDDFIVLHKNLQAFMHLLKKSVNYECHYTHKIRHMLLKKFQPKDFEKEMAEEKAKSDAILKKNTQDPNDLLDLVIPGGGRDLKQVSDDEKKDGKNGKDAAGAQPAAAGAQPAAAGAQPATAGAQPATAGAQPAAVTAQPAVAPSAPAQAASQSPATTQPATAAPAFIEKKISTEGPAQPAAAQPAAAQPATAGAQATPAPVDPIQEASKKGKEVLDSIKKEGKGKHPVDASGGKLFEFLKDNWKLYTDAVDAFFASKVFNSITVMVNCLKDNSPSENLKKIILGLHKKVQAFKTKNYVGPAIDIFCQWWKLKKAEILLRNALNPQNMNRQWEFFAEMIVEMINIFKI